MTEKTCSTCKGFNIVPAGTVDGFGYPEYEPCSECGPRIRCANHRDRSVVMGTKAAEGWTEGPAQTERRFRALGLTRRRALCSDCSEAEAMAARWGRAASVEPQVPADEDE